MKKLFAIMVLVMTALAVNAQRTPVKVADLQKAIKDNITSGYAGFTIKEATKVVSNNVTEFEVVITKGTSQETLLYANDGKFIKKVTAKEGSVAKSSSGHTEHTKTPVKSPVK